MKNNILYLNIFFQVTLVLLIANLFIFEVIDLNKLSFIFSDNSFIVFILLIFLKLYIAYLFFLIINTIISKKLDIIEISNTFLQGGIVSLLIPGGGILFKYFKLRTLSNITLAEYSISQSLWSLGSFLSYLLLGLSLGFLKIVLSIPLHYVLLLSLVLFLIFIIMFLVRNKVYVLIRNNILMISRIQKIISELKSIKQTIAYNKHKFIYIFFLFIILSLSQSYVFYLAVKAFGVEIDFLTSSFLYISSSLVTVIAMINFIGLFELIISFSASFVTDNFIDMAFIGFGFRILYIFALVIAIFCLTVLGKLKNLKLI